MQDIYLWGLCFLALCYALCTPYYLGLPDTKPELTDGEGCALCKYLVSYLDSFIKENKTFAVIKEIAVEVCEELDIEVKDVCIGSINAYAPDLYVLLKNDYLSPDTICGTLYGSQCANTSLPAFWNVTLPNDNPPPKYIPLSSPPSGKPTLRILHIADLHIDPAYVVGSRANCPAPQCCNFDFSGPNVVKAQPFATLSNCDIPKTTVESMLHHLSDQEFDLVYWTGDITPHNAWNQSKEMQMDLNDEVTALIKMYLPNAKVYPAVGNHETYPINIFPFPNINFDNDPNPSKWLYSTLEKNWQSWLNDSTTSSTILKGGYYSTKLTPKLRLISYNGGFGLTSNYFALTNVKDPYGQLEWLARELQDAEDAGEFVHIIGHEPPYDSTTETYRTNYYRIVRKYANTVRGQFAAHTHKDEFRVFYEDSKDGICGEPYGMMYVAPSLTTYTNLNPAYRIYTVDGDWENSTWSVIDFDEYTLNLTKAQLHNEEPQWEYLYSPIKDYSMKSLFPQDWSDLIKRFKTDDPLFHKVFRHFTRRNSFNPQNSTIKVDFMEKFSSGNYGNCNLL